MTTLRIVQGIFFIAAICMGVAWGYLIADQRNAEEVSVYVLSGILLGGGIAAGILLALNFVTQEAFDRLAPAFGAVVLGLLTGWGVAQYVNSALEIDDASVSLFITTTFALLFGYVGIALGLTRASNWEALVRAMDRRPPPNIPAKIVDTSVLIDGRIADMAETGFLEGQLFIPRFVLHELQHIADSPDDLRRARGRRGLDIVKSLQDDSSKVFVEVLEDNPQGIKEVDAKLVHLAQKYSAKVMTNDFNLNKVAQIEGVDVLNINDLANALKPAVLPDEAMTLRIVKEGKEAQQGVGYLDDGTMIVVDGAKQHVGKEVSVQVTSVLQTAAGRMIFSKLKSVEP